MRTPHGTVGLAIDAAVNECAAAAGNAACLHRFFLLQVSECHLVALICACMSLQVYIKEFRRAMCRLSSRFRIRLLTTQQ